MAITLRVLKALALSAPTTGTTTQLNDGAVTKGWLVKKLCFQNTTANLITIDVYVQRQGGTSTYLCKQYQVAASGTLLIDGDITLNHAPTSDQLTAALTGSTSGQTLNCILDGIERDQ